MHSAASVSPSSGRPPRNHSIADLGIPQLKTGPKSLCLGARKITLQDKDRPIVNGALLVHGGFLTPKSSPIIWQKWPNFIRPFQIQMEVSARGRFASTRNFTARKP